MNSEITSPKTDGKDLTGEITSTYSNYLCFTVSIRTNQLISQRKYTSHQQENYDLITSLQDTASKGKSGGTIWLNMELKSALGQLLVQEGDVQSTNNFVRTERSKGTSAQAIVNMFACWYRDLGFDGCSSHSGRRTFITNAARKISTGGGSMRDVQILARHASLNMTMRYVDADKEAMRKVVELV